MKGIRYSGYIDFKKHVKGLFLALLVLLPAYLGAQTKESNTGKNTFDTVVHLQGPAAKTDTGSTPLVNVSSIAIHDSAVATKKKRQPNPKKAGLYSALVPGLGQVYDGKYWKVPFIYGGLTVAAYYFEKNLNDYQDYRKAYIGRFNNPYYNDKYKNIYTQPQLKLLQDESAKYLDLTVLFTGVGYILQIMDAVVYAHLKNFDISEDLSMKIQPVANPQGIGMGLVFNIKGKHVLLPQTD